MLAAVGVLGTVLVLVVVLVGRGGAERAVLPGGSVTEGASPAVEDTRGDAAAALLDRLADLLQHGTGRQVAALAAPGDPAAAGELRALRANVRTLRITDLAFRYVDDTTGKPVGGQPALGGDDWVADVSVTWRLAGFDTHRDTMEVPLVLRDTGRRAAFVSSRRIAGGAVPLWMLDRVSAARSQRSLVVTDDPSSLRRFAGLADQAVLDVRKVLPRWRGRLVVEVPDDQPQLNRVLGAQHGDYAEIAAVTTTADRSTSRTAPVHVFVNPRVFDPLGPRGSQIVMSHETTHVATGAALSTMPTWLIEGFADYVALDHADLPVAVTASQILRQVRRRGAPSHLPTAADFGAQDTGLGARYESAWLACRLIAQAYGERRLIEFYRASDRASSTTATFGSVLGTDQRSFTRLWRQDLAGLAG